MNTENRFRSSRLDSKSLLETQLEVINQEIPTYEEIDEDSLPQGLMDSKCYDTADGSRFNK